MHHPRLSKVPMVLVLVPLVFFSLVVVTADVAWAQGYELGETSVVVPAGGEATIPFETFCLEFGKEFPTSLGRPDGRASAAVLRPLKVAIQRGLTDSDPLQTQLAIWHQVEGDWPYAEDVVDRDVAQQLLDESENADVAAIEGEGMPLEEAVSSGAITASARDFRFVDVPVARPDDEPYKGRGTLVLTNEGDADVEVFFQYGTVFRAANDAEQDIVTYATQLEQLPTNTPTASPAPTRTPGPTPDRLPSTGSSSAPTTGRPILAALFGLGLGLLGVVLKLRSA